MKRNSKLFILIYLAALSAFGPLVTDAYLPALPNLRGYFQINESLVQLTLTTTMIGLALGQLIAGPISDKFGRKLPLTWSLLTFTIATIWIFFTDNFWLLIILRTLQGLACAAGIVISRAIAKDIYDGEELRKFFIIMMMVGSLAPIFAPIFGSMVLKYNSIQEWGSANFAGTFFGDLIDKFHATFGAWLGDWHGIFVALSVVGAALFLANFSFYESLPPQKRLSGQNGALHAYKLLLGSRKFMLFIAVCTSMMTGMFAYIAASSFIYQDKFAVSPTVYALLFASNGAVSVVASIISAKMSAKMALRAGAYLFLLSAVIIAFALIGDLPIYAVIAGFMLLMFSLGFTEPTASYLAMQKAPHYAGAASAILGFTMFFAGGLISPVVGLGNMMITTSVVILLMAVLCFITTEKSIKSANL